ncbi:hypothetical protein [Mycolicibacterium tusciae]|uniref:hypothetical protein n=1 Tax=Mycolicibacterium tusciae TaxID=75922 RepID=UPI00024A32D3|nr:hypothetical protein [Mycolicibacterium tusciae]
MTTNGADHEEIRYESVFRASWRDRQRAGARPGELIRNPRWLDAGLATLVVALIGGAVAAGTITVEQTATMPAVVQGTTLTADRAAGPPPPPAPGAAVQFRHAFGLPVDAVIVDVTGTEVTARLQEPTPASAGELVVPAERQRLIDVFLPRFW